MRQEACEVLIAKRRLYKNTQHTVLPLPLSLSLSLYLSLHYLKPPLAINYGDCGNGNISQRLAQQANVLISCQRPGGRLLLNLQDINGFSFVPPFPMQIEMIGRPHVVGNGSAVADP